MPRRRMRKLPPVGDPRREVLLAASSVHAQKMLKGAIREAARGKLDRRRALSEAAEILLRERETALEKNSDMDFTPREKAEVEAIIREETRKLNTDDVEKKKIAFQCLSIINSVRDAVSAGSLTTSDYVRETGVKLPPRAANYARQTEPAVNQMLSGIGYSVLLQQELNAHGINVPLKTIYHKLVKTDAKLSRIDDGIVLGKIFMRVEKSIIQEMKRERTDKLVQRENANKDLHLLRSKISRFSIPRNERKQLLNEAREKIGSHSTGVPEWFLGRGFKRSRMFIRNHLQKLGMDPDAIFLSLEIDRDNAAGVKRLKILSHVLRTAKTDVDAKSLVDKVVSKYGRKHATGGNLLSSTAFTRTIERNPRKQAEREERSARQRAEEEAAKAPKPKPQNGEKKYPTTAGGFAALYGKEKRVTDEMAIALNNFLQGVRPRQFLDAQIDQLVEHQILTQIATQFQKSGRVSETALRELTVPQTLIEHFKRALRSLMKKKYLQYEAHAGHKNFVAITDAAAKKILGKYNTKIARLHENGG